MKKVMEGVGAEGEAAAQASSQILGPPGTVKLFEHNFVQFCCYQLTKHGIILFAFSDNAFFLGQASNSNVHMYLCYQKLHLFMYTIESGKATLCLKLFLYDS